MCFDPLALDHRGSLCLGTFLSPRCSNSVGRADDYRIQGSIQGPFESLDCQVTSEVIVLEIWLFVGRDNCSFEYLTAGQSRVLIHAIPVQLIQRLVIP